MLISLILAVVASADSSCSSGFKDSGHKTLSSLGPCPTGFVPQGERGQPTDWERQMMWKDCLNAVKCTNLLWWRPYLWCSNPNQAGVPLSHPLSTLIITVMSQP
jgi:hypothetical protein